MLNNANRVLAIPLWGATFKQRCSALLLNITMTMIWLNSNQLNCLVLYHFRKNSNYVHGQCSFTTLTIYLVACYQGALVCFYQISILRHMHRGDAPTNKETAVGWRLDWKFTGFFLIGSTIFFSFILVTNNTEVNWSRKMRCKVQRSCRPKQQSYILNSTALLCYKELRPQEKSLFGCFRSE